MYCTTECHYQSKLHVQYATEAIGLRQNRDERQLAYGKQYTGCNQSPEKLEKDARVILRWLGKRCMLQEDIAMSADYSDIIRCSRTLSHIVHTGTWLERFQILAIGWHQLRSDETIAGGVPLKNVCCRAQVDGFEPIRLAHYSVSQVAHQQESVALNFDCDH